MCIECFQREKRKAETWISTHLASWPLNSYSNDFIEFAFEVVTNNRCTLPGNAKGIGAGQRINRTKCWKWKKEEKEKKRVTFNLHFMFYRAIMEIYFDSNRPPLLFLFSSRLVSVLDGFVRNAITLPRMCIGNSGGDLVAASVASRLLLSMFYRHLCALCYDYATLRITSYISLTFFMPRPSLL